MAKYFEVTVTISKRVFLTVEDSETCDSVQDYVHDSYANENVCESIEISKPVQLTKPEDICAASRHCDDRITNV